VAARKNKATPGQVLVDQLAMGVRQAESAPRAGARELPVVHGLTFKGECLNLENVLVQAGDILVETGRVYSYGTSIVMEKPVPGEAVPGRVTLFSGKAEVGAEDNLANLFVCSEYPLGRAIQFSPQRGFVDVLLRSEPFVDRLPRIRQYARAPVFDSEFKLRGPGWHPDTGILVHGPQVDPAPFVLGGKDTPVLHRLPPHLRELLRDFCFATPADLANTVAMLLTGLLVNHFVQEPKPLGILDGNQPSVGKTWLCRTIGIVLGGTDPDLILYTPDDEELAKRLCATLVAGRDRVLVFDNARTKGGAVLESAAIEKNCVAPEISLRILGKSRNLTKPNDLLWFITMNRTRANSDLVSRCLPIRLEYEGDPKDRTFLGTSPLDYARDHRLALLGELAGMVMHWVQRGRPVGNYAHRCGPWAKTIGGIMMACGFPEFLGNLAESASDFSTELDDLSALAEAAAQVGRPFAYLSDTSSSTSNNLPE
jgi:hypothetical protein